MMRKRRMVYTVVIVLAVITAVTFGAKLYIEAGLENLKTLNITDADLSKLEDGVYTGSYRAFPVAAEVRVTIAGNKITGIELVRHSNGQGATAEVIPDRVIAAQSLEVDMVSGATYSSKVILKAIEDALNRTNK